MDIEKHFYINSGTHCKYFSVSLLSFLIVVFMVIFIIYNPQTYEYILSL